MTKLKWPRFSDIHTLVFDFDGVFTDNKVYVGQDGSEFVKCDRADGLAFNILKKLKDKSVLDCEIFILSTETNPVVSARAKKLQINCYQGVSDKLGFLKDFFLKKYPQKKDPFKGMIYLGNDLNDLSVIETDCFSVVPKDAHELVKDKASVCIPVNGGQGFIRIFVESWLLHNGVDIAGLF